MRAFATAILLAFFLASASCSTDSDNRHTTATTVVSPPARQVLHVTTRPGPKLTAKPADQDPNFNPKNPFLVFNFENGKTFRENEEVVIDFSLANVKLKGDGGEFRVRYIVDDEEMRWIDRWEQVVLTGWLPGKHTIRLELIGTDGWPAGDRNVAVRELTITK
jgi:hypothetical protein